MFRRLVLVVGCLGTLSGCMDVPDHQYRFNVGDSVTIKVNDRPAIIVDCYLRQYSVRYADDLGQIHYIDLKEFELAPRSK